MRKLTAELANLLATIALGHVGREYPNKLDHVLDGPGDALGPRALGKRRNDPLLGIERLVSDQRVGLH